MTDAAGHLKPLEQIEGEMVRLAIEKLYDSPHIGGRAGSASADRRSTAGAGSRPRSAQREME
ncbi:MAG: hypothetical protein U1E87_10690 [Alphaproteobacteria bacterium]